MIRNHKHLLFFSSVLTTLLVATTLILKKYVPLFLHHTVYYCQELMRSFSIQMPKSLGSLTMTFGTILGGIFLLRLLYTFVKIYLFRQQLLAKHRSRKSTHVLEKKLNLIGRVLVIEDTRPLAFCFGIRKPKIYLSTEILKITNHQELEAVLLHEKYHLEQRDGLTHLIASMTTSLFPFFPVLTDLINKYHVNREMNADETVVQAMRNATPLISVIKKFLLQDPTPVFAFAPALAEWDTLELRIKALIKQKVLYPRLSFIRVGLSFLSMAIMYALLVAPVNAVELHDKQEDVMMVCVQGNECANWCKKNATVVPQMSKAPNSTPLSSSVFSSQ